MFVNTVDKSREDLIMIRNYGHWILLILIIYVVSVFYIISTLKLDTSNKRDDSENEFRQTFQEKTDSRDPGGRQNINSVVVESSEDDLSNLGVGRNILIEKANIENKQELQVSAVKHRILTNDRVERLESTITTFKPIGDQYHVYSAYLDDRLLDSYIRIVAVGPRNKQKHKSGLWCVFQKDTRNQNNSLLTDVRLSETCENHHKLSSFYLMSCIVPKVVVKEFRQNELSHIFITSTKSAKSGLGLTVVNNVPFRSQNKTKSQFSVCVPPLYGSPKPLHLVEFIELSRQLGAEHFTFYRYKVSNEIQSILRFYENLGIVTVANWNIPDVDHIWNYGQSAAIADCVYRNMFQYRIVVFNDIDEYVIPRHLASWRTMLVYLENQNRRRNIRNVAAYSIKSAFFHGNTENVTSQWRLFKSLSNILRTRNISEIRTKLMVYPETVFELGIHHLSQPIKSHYKTIDVDLNTALVHHYRSCGDIHDMNCGSFIEDYTAQRYGAMLVENTRRVLRRAKDNYNNFI